MQGQYSRIQFTPDLLPADVVGTMIYNVKDNDFSIKKGPVFANFVLADEINRAPAKVQSALLEVMQEKQVTIGDTTMKLPKPFLVLATQNPIDQEGTYLLPEAQSDRFMMKCSIDYPTFEDERKVMRMVSTSDIPQINPIISLEQIVEAKELINKIYLDEKIEKYILDMVLQPVIRNSMDYRILKLYYFRSITKGVYQPCNCFQSISVYQRACIRYSGRCERNIERCITPQNRIKF